MPDTEPAFLAVPIALAKALDAMLAADPRVQAFLALRACLPVPEAPAVVEEPAP